MSERYDCKCGYTHIEIFFSYEVSCIILILSKITGREICAGRQNIAIARNDPQGITSRTSAFLANMQETIRPLVNIQ